MPIKLYLLQKKYSCLLTTNRPLEAPSDRDLTSISFAWIAFEMENLYQDFGTQIWLNLKGGISLEDCCGLWIIRI